MKLSLGFSPCPNDTFMFDAMVHHKIDTEGLEFEVLKADIEELNTKAFQTAADVTKLSYFAYSFVSENYQLLNSGSAIGYNNGPLLIAKKIFLPEKIQDLKVAIPGKYTTANLLFRAEYPYTKEIREYLFSDIEIAVLSGEVDAGVIIHENRFTYEAKGLKKIADLGEVWVSKTSYPIPLGGIAIKRSLDAKIKEKVGRILKRSVEYAFRNPADSFSFVKENAQEMDEEVIRKHIDLYVNDFSIDLGIKGKLAIKAFFSTAKELGIITKLPHDIFFV
jgi:1,4-dihydroxy-6-naphthoate synthase